MLDSKILNSIIINNVKDIIRIKDKLIKLWTIHYFFCLFCCWYYFNKLIVNSRNHYYHELYEESKTIIDDTLNDLFDYLDIRFLSVYFYISICLETFLEIYLVCIMHIDWKLSKDRCTWIRLNKFLISM